MSVTNEIEVGLPPLSPKRRAVWDYYRIEFLEDGYPGRRIEDEVHAHPIYGPYVISDYLGQYRLTGDERFLEGARRVADAAIRRMQPLKDSLVFRYQPGTGLSSLSQPFYSGLTQGRYLSTLGRLQRALGVEAYQEECEAVLRSLVLPASEGGVARRTPSDGLLIEEYPHSVPDYTLNGWTTATLLVHEYAQATGSETAQQLFEDSVRGIDDVLPLYDVPELANSRYRLTGPVTIKLLFRNPGTRMLFGGVKVPGQGFYPLGSDTGTWTNRYLRGVDADGQVDTTQTSVEVLLSRISWPEPNRIYVELESELGGRVALQVGEGPYNPLSVRPVVDRWTTIHKVDVEPGRHVIDVPIPWVSSELAAYPTSFTKSIEGRKYNSYHFIHVDALTKLAQITGEPMFEYYRDRWATYPGRWPSMPEYAHADIELDRHTI